MYSIFRIITIIVLLITVVTALVANIMGIKFEINNNLILAVLVWMLADKLND